MVVFNSGLTNRSFINIFEYLKISFTFKHDENSSLKAELTKLFGDQKENIEKAAGCLKVLAHPARLQIMCALRNGEQTVQDLEFLTGLRQTTLSQHLSLLKNRDVLASRREANFSFYRIANMRMVELFNLVQDIFCHMPKGS